MTGCDKHPLLTAVSYVGIIIIISKYLTIYNPGYRKIFIYKRKSMRCVEDKTKYLKTREIGV